MSNPRRLAKPLPIRRDDPADVTKSRAEARAALRSDLSAWLAYTHGVLNQLRADAEEMRKELLTTGSPLAEFLKTDDADDIAEALDDAARMVARTCLPFGDADKPDPLRWAEAARIVPTC